MEKSFDTNVKIIMSNKIELILLLLTFLQVLG